MGPRELSRLTLATGLYIIPDGKVMVAYGNRQVPISPQQYRANGYKPPIEKLMVKTPNAVRAELSLGRQRVIRARWPD